MQMRKSNGANGGRAAEPVPRFRGVGWRMGDTFVSGLARLGIGPIHLLTTRGRRTGRPHTKPVVPVDHDGRRWLVAPYGPVAWVKNARATNTIGLRYGRVTRRYVVREVPAHEAGPVLKRYLAVATKVRSRFPIPEHSPVEEFIAVAPRYPVFELMPITENQSTTFDTSRPRAGDGIG